VGATPTEVWAVDPASDEVAVRFDMGDTIESLSMTVTTDAVWVGVRRPGRVGAVLRFDLESHYLTGEADVSLPGSMLEAFGWVWVTDWNRNQLVRFQP
jgi:hypothetical protein